MKNRKVHYLGGIEYKNGWRLTDWVCCCTGDKCTDLTNNGLTTYNREEVTCKGCLSMIQKHDEYIKIKDKSPGLYLDTRIKK